MQAFTVHTGVAAPLCRSDVDTDQIIPAEYLKRVSRTGFADGLFQAWRTDPEFVLNQPEFADASILVAGERFGVGSSREHAVWALRDYGFRAVIASSFGDIFRTNAVNGGLVPVQLADAVVARLCSLLARRPGRRLTVDLIRCRVCVSGSDLVADSAIWPFSLDRHARWRLLEGHDDIGLTLRHEASISAHEAARPSWWPVVS